MNTANLIGSQDDLFNPFNCDTCKEKRVSNVYAIRGWNLYLHSFINMWQVACLYSDPRSKQRHQYGFRSPMKFLHHFSIYTLIAIEISLDSKDDNVIKHSIISVKADDYYGFIL